jgi:exodeoxyribonuclease VII small subunit|tara:strand:+ start:3973 stop:4254 length:282 start_codon:yes stop_codon:yes gene_type:complete
MNNELENEKSDESFEQLLTKLDETVRKLEAGGLSLEQSTDLYEQGLKLARECTEKISTAELKITKIRNEYGQNVSSVNQQSLELEYDSTSEAE